MSERDVGPVGVAESAKLGIDVPAEEVRAQLRRILGSTVFVRSERLTHFLTFIVEEALQGRQGDLKEYRVGVVVCGRRESYDPRTDPVVRVEARRLRSALDVYYAQEGGKDAVLISLPKGGYAPSFAYPRSASPEVPAAPAPVRRRWKKALTLALTGVIVMAASGIYLFSHGKRGASPTNTIVLADFSNTTGDAVFDDALRQGLAAQMAQSPYLNLLSDARVAQTLTLMGKPRGTRLTADLAREVCERTGETVVIQGSISNLGKQYVLGMKAINCHTGDLLAEEQDLANGKEQVMGALASGATKLRHRLGESLASVQKYDAPPENVTTPSLEALQAYSLGFRVHTVNLDEAGAAALFERAVALDPHFAMAYARLAVCYSNLGELSRAVENMRKAYELQSQVSEHERLFILSLYHEFVTGNLEEARKTYELRAQIYPYDDIPIGNVGNVYFLLGRYDKALADTQEALRRNPGSRIWNGNLVSSYIALGQLPEAKAAAESARSRQLDSPWLHLCLYLIAFQQGDARGMEQETAQLKGVSGFEDVLVYYRAQAAARAGRISDSRALSQLAVEMAQHAAQTDSASVYMAQAAMNEAWAGNLALAKRKANEALHLSNGRDEEAIAAVALAVAGDSAGALHLADDLAKRYPEDTIVRFHFIPTIHAAAALHGKAPAREYGKALDALAAAAPYELGSMAMKRVAFLTCYPIYFRGEAYLASQQGALAAAEFQKVLDHPQLTLTDPVGAMATLGLARAYALSGDRGKSRAAYERFLALWKNSEPGAPLRKQAERDLGLIVK